MAHCRNAWRSHSLSYAGKAVIVNMLALPRIWYVESLVHIPPWVLTQLNQLVFHFFWSGKRDLVARKVMYQLREAGDFSVN